MYTFSTERKDQGHSFMLSVAYVNQIMFHLYCIHCDTQSQRLMEQLPKKDENLSLEV